MAQEKLPKGTATVALLMVLGALPTMLDSTIVNVALNGLAKTFETTLPVIQWAVTGYVLAMGVAVPFSGWLIRRFDGKKIFLGALGLFMLGSLLSALSWNAASLIAFRFLQGFSAGILMPLLSTLAVQLAGSDNLGKLMSLIGIPVVFAPIIGPVAGGLIMQYLPWQWLFLINLPLGAIGLVFLQWKMPRFEATEKSARLDWPGTALLAIGSGTLIYGVTEVMKADGRSFGAVLLVVGAAALAAYAAYALKRKEKALVPLGLFRSKNFSAAFISLFLAGFATNGPMLLFPMFFQNVRGLSVITAALWLIPQGVGMLIARPAVGRLVDRIGARFVVLPAIAATLIGTVPFVFFDANTSQWLVWAVLLVRGAGVGGFTVPLMADCFVGLAKPQVPTASVATRIIQNIGGAFGSAFLATVVSTFLATQAGNLTGAYHAGFIASVCFMVAGIMPALFLTNKLRKERPAPAAEQPSA
ncbi:MAG: multidrug efflux MFS transporter [Eggerthellaceae bacterium]|nr:multidrug efflux MFS transporter [Eggerthellaceae bacterium]